MQGADRGGGSTFPQLLLGHAADKESLTTIKRIASFATQSSVPSKPIYISSAKLVKE